MSEHSPPATEREQLSAELLQDVSLDTLRAAVLDGRNRTGEWKLFGIGRYLREALTKLLKPFNYSPFVDQDDRGTLFAAYAEWKFWKDCWENDHRIALESQYNYARLLSERNVAMTESDSKQQWRLKLAIELNIEILGSGWRWIAASPESPYESILIDRNGTHLAYRYNDPAYDGGVRIDQHCPISKTTRDMNFAWEVVTAMQKNGWEFSIESKPHGWVASFVKANTAVSVGDAEPATAICHAALQTLGENQNSLDIPPVRPDTDPQVATA